MARIVPQPVRTQSSNDAAGLRLFGHNLRLTARLGAVRESLTMFSSVDLRGSVDHPLFLLCYTLDTETTRRH